MTMPPTPPMPPAAAPAPAVYPPENEEVTSFDVGIDETILADPTSVDVNMPEAGGIAWTELFDPKTGAKINLTTRQHSAKHAVDYIMAVIQYAVRTYGLVANRTNYSAAPSGSAPAGVPQKGSAVEVAKGTPGEAFVADRVKVVSDVNGKGEPVVTIEFYEDSKYGKNGGRAQFPTQPKIQKWKVSDVVKLFAEGTGMAWTPQHFSQPCEITTHKFLIEWAYGDLNRQGTSRYKNVTAVKLAA